MTSIDHLVAESGRPVRGAGRPAPGATDSLPDLPPQVSAELARARTRLAWGPARAGRGVVVLQEVGATLADLARECGPDSLVGRRLAAVRDGLASYQLAVADLEAAGVPAAQQEAMVERGRRQAAGALDALLD